jgi:hypothetical protein
MEDTLSVFSGEGLQTAYAKKTRKSTDHRFSSGCRLGTLCAGGEDSPAKITLFSR